MPPSRTKSKQHSASSPSSDDSPASLKKESSLKDLKDDKLKRKRQSQSCDACRARKVRCARPDTPDIDGDATASESTGGMTIATTTGPDGKKEVAQCKHCIALGIKCTYDYQPKKRGPPNLYLRRLQEAAAAAAQHGQESSGSPTSTGLVSHTSALTINSPGGLNGYGLNNTGSGPVVPSHRLGDTKPQTNGYFVNGAANAGSGHTQMVVPSQGFQQQQQSPEFSHAGVNNSNGYHQTHSFMDTNSITSVSTNASGAGGNNGLPNLPTLPTLPALPNLPSLSMPSLPNLPSLPSLPMWQSSSPATSIASENHSMSSVLHHNSYPQNGQSINNPLAPQVLTTPMHLQPSPARLSPVSASLSLSHHHQSTLNGINGNGPLPPSRYPIAADMNGIGRPPSSSGSASETKTPTQAPTLDPRMGSPHIDPSKSVIGQRYVHHYASTSGSLPAFVHSRPTSPANGQSSNNDHASGQANNCMSLHPDGSDMVPLTPATAAEIFPQYPMYNWSMPYKSLDHQSHSNSESGADVFGGGVASANANASALTASSPTLIASSAVAAVSTSTSASSPLLHPPLAQFHRPHSLETIAPLPTIMHILSLFFDFVYPLTPCVHKPSFYQGLMEKREERDPLFFALVCSTVASTLVQVPRSYLPMERDEVRKLAKRFSEASRLVTVASYDPPCSAMVVIRYFDTVYHFCEGHDATSHAAFGEAAHIAVTLHMHEEASYEGLDYIESEIRRRAFWLLFDADKSMSILLGRPICLRDEDCTLHFPREVDDEYITQHTIHPQPPHKTAVVSGLNYISRIFALLGEILVRIRVDKRCPPQGPFAIARLEEVRALHTRICNALAHTPPELRLKPITSASLALKSSVPSSASSTAGSTASTDSGTRVEYGGAGFTKNTFAEIKEFFDNPNASRENASNPFLVMQANLYVTQQLVRFVIEQYRDELITSMRESGVDFSAHGSVAAELARGSWTSDDREAVASDLLTVLHSIPIQSIATNGPSLVHKVRFVASTLLDAVRKAETAPASAARAHAYLWDFLSILSEIERNYLLADDREEFDA